MTIRMRKLVGTIVLLVGICVYALVLMVIAGFLQVNGSKLVELAFYVVGGLAWVWPATKVVTWMQRSD